MKNRIPGILGLLLLVFLSCKQESQTSRKALDSQEVTTQGEAHRLKFHFTPPSMWMNDPNGMFYLDGEYHLSYQ